MRALIVAAAPQAGSVDLVAGLAARCDLVVAVDGGGAVCLEAGVTPHVVLGDFDSLAPEALEQLVRGGARSVSFPQRKDQTDLELAFDEVRARGAGETVVTCATFGRLDHTLAALGALAANADLQPELAEPHISGWVLSSEARPELMLRGAGATVSLLAIAEPAIVSVKGMEWPLTHFRLLPGSGLGVSNVITASIAEVTAQTGVVLVLAPDVPGAPRATSA